MPAAKKPAARTSKPVSVTARVTPLFFTPPAQPPNTSGDLILSRTQRDALVARLDEAERQFLGGFPLGAKSMIAGVSAKLKSL